MGSQAGGSDGLSDLHTTKLAKARMELEQLYMGVPDESVNLTFQDFADVKHRVVTPPPPPLPPSDHQKIRSSVVRPPANNGSLNKLPSLNFNRAVEASRPNHYHHNQHIHGDKNSNVQEPPMAVDSPISSYNPRHNLYQDVIDTPRDPADSTYNMMTYNSGQDQKTIIPVRNIVKQQETSSSISTHQGMSPNGGYDDMTSHSSAVKNQAMRSPRGVGVLRQGIPHSKICTICSTYVYVFRHRCLVCGRVYCRNCVNIGMGEMSEGRKCVECLGRRFSQRYIKKAGKTQGWCWWWSYPDQVKQQELKWTEKGPRIRNLSTSSRYNYNSEDISRTSIIMTPSAMGADAYSYNYKHQSSHHDQLNNPPSFVATPSSSYSPYLTF